MLATLECQPRKQVQYSRLLQCLSFRLLVPLIVSLDKLQVSIRYEPGSEVGLPRNLSAQHTGGSWLMGILCILPLRHYDSTECCSASLPPFSVRPGGPSQRPDWDMEARIKLSCPLRSILQAMRHKEIWIRYLNARCIFGCCAWKRTRAECAVDATSSLTRAQAACRMRGTARTCREEYAWSGHYSGVAHHLPDCQRCEWMQ